MLFNSVQFAIFFPLVTALYFAAPHRARWAVLLGASCLFYMAFIPAYIVVLFFLIGLDYVAARLIEPASGHKRRVLLATSLVANIGMLGVFKYYNFLAANITALGTAAGVPLHPKLLSIVLPIGLSFHTFQAMAYTIEVFRGRQPAERHLGIYALYVMFYPQLVAGPIERPQHLLPQFREHMTANAGRIASGLKLMAWGLFKKVVIADRLALIVNPIFDLHDQYHGLTLIIAVVFFAWQIYCDFSGYSDIAIGAAEVMGFRLSTNFKAPYLSASVREFWTRWHISLSTWFRDYLYIPLGGNRSGRPRWIANLLLTFLISGLWHGANWTFVIWGILNGVYLAFSELTAPVRQVLRTRTGLAAFPSVLLGFRRMVTFALIGISWVFFRAPSVSVAWDILKNACDVTRSSFHVDGVTAVQIVIGASLVIGLWLVEWKLRGEDPRRAVGESSTLMRWSLYYTVVCITLVFGVFGGSQFIYFQF